MVRLNLFSVRLGLGIGLGLIVGFGIGGAFVGVGGCNTQSLVPRDGGAARGGSGGTSAPGTGGDQQRHRATGTSAAARAPPATGADSGAGGVSAPPAPAAAIGTTGAGGFTGTSGAGGITGAAGFGRPFGGAAGHGSSVGGGAGSGAPPVDASTTTPPVRRGETVSACSAPTACCGCRGTASATNYSNGAPMAEMVQRRPRRVGLFLRARRLQAQQRRPDHPRRRVGLRRDRGHRRPADRRDDPVFVCPSDPSLKAAVVAGGQFPPSGCAVTNCTCGDAGAVNCPMPDAGATPINPF